MKFLAAVAVILSLLGLVLGQGSISGQIALNGLTYEANGNISVSSSDNTYHFRQTGFIDVANVNLYTSVAVDASGSGSSSGGSAKATVDAIIGVTAFPLSIIGIPLSKFTPSSWLGYIHADAFANFDLTNTGAIVSGGVSGTAALAAKAFYALQEVDASGKVVATKLLKDRTWTSGGIKKAANYLQYVTYSSKDEGFWVNVTIAVSAVTGRLSVGGAIITPRNIESFVEIGGYSYASATNKLNAIFYAATVSASASATVSGNTVSAGTGKDEVYFHFDGSAIVDGSKTGVTVSGTKDTSLTIDDFESSLKTTINAAATGSLKADFRKVVIAFPANAKVITYDPAFGFAPPNELSSGSFLAPSFILAILSAFFFFVKF